MSPAIKIFPQHFVPVRWLPTQAAHCKHTAKGWITSITSLLFGIASCLFPFLLLTGTPHSTQKHCGVHVIPALCQPFRSSSIPFHFPAAFVAHNFILDATKNTNIPQNAPITLKIMSSTSKLPLRRRVCSTSKIKQNAAQPKSVCKNFPFPPVSL